MCLACEEEAFYRAYLEYMARKAAESEAQGKTPAAPKRNEFAAEAVEEKPAAARAR